MFERLADITERIAAGFGALRERVPEIVSDPRAYPRESMLLAIVVALAVIFVVTLVIVVWDSSSHYVRTRRAGVRVRRRFPFARFAIGIVVAAGVVVALVLAPHFVVPSRLCGECHATVEARDEWAVSEHSVAGCYDCHATPGLNGALAASWQGLTYRVTGTTAAPGSSVDSRACLACHEDVASEVVGTAVRVRHYDIIEAGIRCTGCHGKVGHGLPHGDDSPLQRSRMGRCLVCHDDRTAPAACETCHPDNPSDAATVPSGSANQIVPTCAGCHSSSLEGECIACHGLELPHPTPFLSEHAGLSANDPALCAKCHETAVASLSCGCHPDGATHGSYSAWFAQHDDQAQTSGPGGCLCHDRGDFAQCRVCHETSPW